MEYRQKRPVELTPEQRVLKEEMDLSYEEEVRKLSDPYYQKKRLEGVTPGEIEAYQTAKQTLWNDYMQASIDSGLWYEVDDNQLLTEAMYLVNDQLSHLNEIKIRLGQKELQLQEIA